jgi:hypothetical protein
MKNKLDQDKALSSLRKLRTHVFACIRQLERNGVDTSRIVKANRDLTDVWLDTLKAQADSPIKGFQSYMKAREKRKNKSFFHKLICTFK